MTKAWLSLAVLAGGALLVYLLAPVLTPFLAAALFAYLGNPLVGRLEARKLPRGVSASLVFGLFLFIVLLTLLILIPLLERQITTFIGKLPGYFTWMQETALPWLRERLGLEETVLDINTLQEILRQHWQKAGGIASSVLGSVSNSGFTFLSWLANLVLIPLVTFYLLRDWNVLLTRIHELLPRQIEPTAVTLARESDEVLGAFLRGQLSVMLALSVIYTTGLWLMGLDLALLIGLTAGLLSFVPYLGFAIGIVAAGIAALVQFQDLLHLLPVLAVFGAGQIIESFWLTPHLIGKRIGLHPVAVIFAVMAGGQLFGFLGVLLALPAAAVIMVLLRHLRERYLSSALYDRTPPG
ncbi:MAG: AI-2E family transporter [Gammaproteobacteria bacterium]|nr:AI-2E family transporter [Gammaproteobacteria bacterium]